jgi:glycosyltransferase involved in cell wall biosynthesis
MPFTTGQIGGSHVSGVSLARGLVDAFGVRAVVIAPEGAEVHALARSEGLETLVSGDAARPRHMPHVDLARTPARIGALKGFGRRAVLHSNDLAALQSWGPAARAVGMTVVHHNRAFDRDRTFNHLVMRLADHVISVSTACDVRLGYLPPARRSVLIDSFTTPLEVVAAGVRSGLIEEVGGPPDTRLVGFVGNFWKRKRPEFFVDIAGRLAAQDPRLRFVIFGREGDVTEDDLRRRMAAAGVPDRVLIAGFRLPPEANLAALDLLLMPAVREPFGRTPVEALLLGVPYVAAADAGHLEIHGRWKGGLLVDPEADADAYAAACRQALAAPAEVVLSMDRRRAVAEELTPARHAADVMDLYRRLLRRA